MSENIDNKDQSTEQKSIANTKPLVTNNNELEDEIKELKKNLVLTIGC